MMSVYRVAVAMLALGWTSHATAQSTTCMNMGGGMVHCDSTPDMSHPQAGGGSLLADLIARSSEQAFQKRIGALLNKGDCAGAAAYAFSKGRLELGYKIRSACSDSQSAATLPPRDQTLSNVPERSGSSPLVTNTPDLENKLRLAAAKANATTPTPLDAWTTATKVESIGTQILISATVNKPKPILTDDIRSNVINQICANASSPELLRAGASIRIKYFDRQSRDLGSVMVTRADCGL